MNQILSAVKASTIPVVILGRTTKLSGFGLSLRLPSLFFPVIGRNADHDRTASVHQWQTSQNYFTSFGGFHGNVVRSISGFSANVQSKYEENCQNQGDCRQGPISVISALLYEVLGWVDHFVDQSSGEPAEGHSQENEYEYFHCLAVIPLMATVGAFSKVHFRASKGRTGMPLRDVGGTTFRTGRISLAVFMAVRADVTEHDWSSTAIGLPGLVDEIMRIVAHLKS